MNTAHRPSYQHDVTIAKGLAIFLVVFGHIVTGTPPQGNEWYTSIRASIYTFHMPFFIYLSGYVYYYRQFHVRAWDNISGFILRRAKRLLIPFFIFGLIIILGKHVMSQIIHVDNYGENIFEDIINLIWNTRYSAAKSVWFIFSLFLMTVFATVALRFIKSPLLLAILSYGVIFLPSTPVLYLDRTMLFLPFFFVGCAAARHHEQWLTFIEKRLWLTIIVFLASLIAVRYIGIYAVSLILCGTLSIPALHGISRTPALLHSKFLDLLGRMSFSIYLLNTVFIGLAKGILLLFISWHGTNFFIFLPILLFVGIAGPILTKILIFRRIKPLDDMTN